MASVLPATNCTSDPLVPDLWQHLRDAHCNVSITSLNQLPIVVANIILILLYIIAALSVIFIIYAGVQYITSSGDPIRTTSAKRTLTNAAVGVVLSSSAYLLVDYLSRQFT